MTREKAYKAHIANLEQQLQAFKVRLSIAAALQALPAYLRIAFLPSLGCF